MLKPDTTPVLATTGRVAFVSESTFVITCLVCARAVLSGRVADMIKYPWSSSGRKPLGSSRMMTATATHITATMAMLRFQRVTKFATAVA